MNLTNLEGCVGMSNIGNKEIFAKNLTYYINRHSKEQKEVADAIGVPSSTFNNWVKGNKYPRIDKIEMLANYFGIMKSDLIEEHTESNATKTISITEDEQKLLELFRKVPENKQALVIQMIQVALGNQK
jgi:transcriptional regulator with XRE-family HTH domain